MVVTDEIILNDQYRMKISSKKLSSGRYQVKFIATLRAGKELYGYLLAEPQESLKSVVAKIHTRLNSLNQFTEYNYYFLHQLGDYSSAQNPFLIFE